jgi:transposase-like protein
MKRGRPTRYKPEFARKARSLCGLGLDNAGLAQTFSVSIATLYRWLDQYPEFGLAVAMGRGDHAGLKEPSQFKRAIGYQYRAARVYRANSPNPVAVDYDHHVLADPKVALRWLSNRRPERWRIEAKGTRRADRTPD